MSNYKMIFQYDGTKYNGFQKQGNTSNTIQEKFENILEHLTQSPTNITASGRTDAGVHALGQVANFRLETSLSCTELLSYINKYLPNDIKVLSLEKASERFHARLSATDKTYAYHIDIQPKADVFNLRYSLSHPEPLNIPAMEQAAKHMLGEHDFKSFCSLRKMKKSTVRTLNSIIFTENNGELVIRYNANGFLYNMVRIMTGTLIEVGEGNISPEDIPAIIQSLDRQKAGPTAPAKGLFLENVNY